MSETGKSCETCVFDSSSRHDFCIRCRHLGASPTKRTGDFYLSRRWIETILAETKIKVDIGILHKVSIRIQKGEKIQEVVDSFHRDLSSASMQSGFDEFIQELRDQWNEILERGGDQR